MPLEALVLFGAGALLFYGAWSIDFGWRGREEEGKVGLPLPGKVRYVSRVGWWWHAWIAMTVGVTLLLWRSTPWTNLLGLVGLALALIGLVLVWYPWHSGHGVLGWGYAPTWNLAFFFGVAGGSALMVLGS